MKIGDTKVRHQQQAVELRTKAQELKDAAGGEKASAVAAKAQVAVHKDTYVVANASAKELQGEAAKLRAEAAEKLREAVGGRGLHALENVARGFGKLMAKLSGQRLETTVSLKSEPDAKAASERLLALAAKKDAAAQAQYAIATNAHAQATAALSKMEGHEKTAANHLAMASKLLVEAKGHDRTAAFAGAAQQAGETVKSFFDDVKKDLAEIGREVAGEMKSEAKLAWGDLKGALVGLLRTGADALVKAAVAFAEEKLGTARAPTRTGTSTSTSTSTHDAVVVAKDVEAKVKDVEKKRVFYVDTKGVATTALPENKATSAFEPGKVSFGAAMPAKPLPNIEAPPKGEKKASESLIALRWASEAAGIDWSGKGTGELKAALAAHKGGLQFKNGASPFEVKARLMERLGLPAGKDRANVHTLHLGAVRAEFAKRTSLGLDRLAPRAELEAASTRSPMEKAMTRIVTDASELVTAKDALKTDLASPTKRAAFETRAKALDTSKAAMLDFIASAPAADRHVLALDTVDVLEVAHGKMGATTKLGFAVETLTEGKFADALKKGLGLDDASFAKARDAALKASEWTTLGELMVPSATMAFPGPLDGAGRAMLTALPVEGAKLAKELKLLDGDALAALEQHLGFATSAGGQMLGVIRMISSLSQRRDFRTKEQLSPDEIHAELMKNARPPDAKVDARLVSFLQPVLADAVTALRS